MSDRFITTEDIKQEMSRAYTGPIDHLFDLMKRQDLLVKREVKRTRKGREQFDTWTRFAAITEEEVEDLLRQGGQRRYASGPSQEEIEIENKLADVDKQIAERIRAGLAAGIDLPLPTLSRMFGLSQIETSVLISCLAPEIDARYERIYGYLHDDMTRRRASTRLALAFCCGSRQEEMRARHIFSPNAPLMKYRLLEIADDVPGGSPFLSQALKVDARIASFLLGEKGFDPRIQDALEWLPPDLEPENRIKTSHEAVAQVLRAIKMWIDNGSHAPQMLFYLYGEPRAGLGGVVREISSRLRTPLLTIDPARTRLPEAGFDQVLFYAFREALFRQSLLHIRNIDGILEKDHDRAFESSLLRQIEDKGSITFLSGEKAWSPKTMSRNVIFLPVQVRGPEYAEQMELWRNEIRGRNAVDDKLLSIIVSKYPASPEQIKDAALTAGAYAALRGADALITAADIDDAVRAKSISNLGSLARKVEANHTLQDIVLPSVQQGQLHEICNHVHYQAVVYGAWGFGRKLSYGKGLTALFSGSPGTGKTMAAEVIAKELDLDLYKIDLSQIVSKYIGETEKNLHQIFREAQTGHGILFFDEADALLGNGPR